MPSWLNIWFWLCGIGLNVLCALGALGWLSIQIIEATLRRLEMVREFMAFAQHRIKRGESFFNTRRPTPKNETRISN